MIRVPALRRLLPHLPYKAIVFALLAAFLVWSWLVQKPPATPAENPNAVVFMWA